jgi:hypothetical protein
MILPVHWFFRSRSRPATLAAFPSTPWLPSPRCSPSGLSRPSRRFPIFRFSLDFCHNSTHCAHTRLRHSPNSTRPVRSEYAARGPVIQARVSQKAYRQWPRCLTQRAGIAPPHAEGDRSSGATSVRETFGFISAPAGVVGGVPLTRARNPWVPEAST